MAEQDIRIALRDVVLEDTFGNFGLKYPLFKYTVVLAELAVKIQRKTFYDIFVPNVRLAQTTRAQSSQPMARFYQDNRFTGLRGCIGGYNPRRAPPVDTDISGFNLLPLRRSATK